ARPLLVRAIRIRKDNVRPVLALVGLEQESGRAAEALAVLQRTLKDQEDHPQLLVLLGELQYEHGQAAEADRLAARLRADSPWAAYLDGSRLLSLGQAVKAARRLEPLEQTLASYPEWPQRLLLLLARCHAACSDFARQ